VFELKSFDFKKKEDKKYLNTLIKLFTKNVEETKLLGTVLSKTDDGFSAHVCDEIGKSSFFVEVYDNVILITPERKFSVSTIKRIGSLIQFSFDPQVNLSDIE
jgi:hypothetical protein